MIPKALRKSFILISLLAISCTKENTTPPGFQVEPGFTLTLVASEPLLTDPVDLEFNEAGDAMVLEMPGYPFEDQQSRIVILKDLNHDGQYDSRVLFAENLQLASSILPFKTGVLVAAPPYLLHVKDMDGDDKAEVVDTLMGGFSTGNLQHNYNGLTYGLDHWIYAANGGNSGKPYWWGDTTSVMELRGQDFRFNLEQKRMERIGKSSGGFGLAMDEYGRLYETHNLRHISHLVFPDRYLNGMRLMKDHTLSNVSDHEENGLARIYPIGEQESRVNHPEQSGYFSGSCGISYYGGGAFGPEYDHTVWVADVVLNLIHVDKVNPGGASFAASRMFEKKEFLASTDRSFRPVNITVGPDGSIYVVDMYRQVIEHPEWIPDEIEKVLDLQAGKDKGRIYKVSKADSHVVSFNIDQWNTSTGMIASLEHPNQWVRKTAHRLLMDQDLTEGELQSLVDLLKSGEAMSRLHALWILQSKSKLTVDQLMKALEDPIAGVRENAMLIAENYLTSNEALLRKCLQLIADEDQRVRMQAAVSISSLPKEMFDRTKNDILEALIIGVTKKMDEWNIAAITVASKYAPVELFLKVASGELDSSHKALLTSLAVSCNTSLTNIEAVLKSLTKAGLNQDIKQSVIAQLNKGNLAQMDGKTLLPTIRELEQSGDISVVSILASFRQKLNLPPSAEFLKYGKASLKNVLDRSLNDSVRYQQMALVELLPYPQKADVLFQCLQNTEPLKIQEAALRQLAIYAEPSIGVKLVERWKSLGPQIRRLAGDLLLYHKIHHDALLTGLENGTINIGEMNFDLERRRTLLWWTDDENTKRRAEALFSDSGVVNRKDAMDRMKSALTLTGFSAKGALLFQTLCSHCHIYGSQGQDVGPVLTEINRKSKESLMHDILDPNAAVETRYINHRLETKGGEVHIGIVDSETDQLIVLKKMGGTKATIYKSDIKNLSSLGTSLMMEGLEGNMTPQEMANLLAFLQNLN